MPPILSVLTKVTDLAAHIVIVPSDGMDKGVMDTGVMDKVVMLA